MKFVALRVGQLAQGCWYQGTTIDDFWIREWFIVWTTQWTLYIDQFIFYGIWCLQCSKGRDLFGKLRHINLNLFHDVKPLSFLLFCCTFKMLQFAPDKSRWYSFTRFIAGWRNVHCECRITVDHPNISRQISSTS